MTRTQAGPCKSRQPRKRSFCQQALTSDSTSFFSRSSMASRRAASMPAYSIMFFSGRTCAQPRSNTAGQHAVPKLCQRPAQLVQGSSRRVPPSTPLLQQNCGWLGSLGLHPHPFLTSSRSTKGRPLMYTTGSSRILIHRACTRLMAPAATWCGRALGVAPSTERQHAQNHAVA